MTQYRFYGDVRATGSCVHCGGRNETGDHNPSKIFLDEPYPPDLLVGPSCLACNNGFSLDEVYLACLLECVVSGDVNPDNMARTNIAGTIRKNKNLAARLSAARRQEGPNINWDIEVHRVRNVVLKLARGHTAYEFNSPQTDEPSAVFFRPICSFGREELYAFENDTGISTFASWPEVGSRYMSRLTEGPNPFENGWIVVQSGRYRFRMSGDGLEVRIVLREYLACVVSWDC
jgi:hypothetical protein